jgi:hypothetical protein
MAVLSSVSLELNGGVESGRRSFGVKGVVLTEGFLMFSELEGGSSFLSVVFNKMWARKLRGFSR